MEGLIEFGGYACKSDFVQGKNRFVITFEQTELKDYQEKMLSGNRCKGILPIFIFRHDSKADIFYEVSGYVRLSEYFQLQPVFIEDLMKIAKNVLFCLEESGRYLIAYEQLPLYTDMVFINPLTKEIRLVFLPGYKSEVSIRSGLIQILSDGTCSASEQEEYISLLSKMKNMFYAGNPGIHQMVKILNMLEKEVNYLEWTKGKKELESHFRIGDREEQYHGQRAGEVSPNDMLGKLIMPINKWIRSLRGN